MAIQLSDLTNGTTVRATGTQPVWEGTAIFDVLMKAVNENINIQYELTRITGSDYATVYLGAIETCIKEATNLLLQKAIADKEIEVKQAQILQLQAATLNTQEDTKFKSAQAVAYPLQSAKDLVVKSQQILTMINDDNIKQEQSAKDLLVKQTNIDVGLEEKRLKAAQADIYPFQSTKDLLVKQANIDLLNRQKEGFNDNKYQKLFEAQMNAWALMFSSGLLETKPSIISNDSASALYNTLKPK